MTSAGVGAIPDVGWGGGRAGLTGPSRGILILTWSFLPEGEVGPPACLSQCIMGEGTPPPPGGQMDTYLCYDVTIICFEHVHVKYPARPIFGQHNRSSLRFSVAPSLKRVERLI